MKFDIKEMRKVAGLAEAEDASPEHVKNEKELFGHCMKTCEEVVAMCEQRLKEKDLSDEHKKQYTMLCDTTKKHMELMKKHLESYVK